MRRQIRGESATVAMTGHLSIDCIVEGVETEQDVAWFRDKPIHAMQGYHFSRPLPEPAFLALLERGRGGATGRSLRVSRQIM